MRTFAIQRDKQQGGFGFVELMIAMLVFTVGVLAVALLIIYGTRTESFARDATIASGVAKARIEILRALPSTDPQRAVGGSLTTNDANHFASITGTPFVVRWVVAAGPAGTQDLTVAVVSTSELNRLPSVQMRSLVP
jgi:Tfp pilus assembly protein PilV